MNANRSKFPDARRLMLIVGLFSAALAGFLLLTKQAAMQTDTLPDTEFAAQSPEINLVLGKLAYQPTIFTNAGGNTRINTINADGSGDTTLAGGIPLYNAEPAWSPDGAKIAYVAALGSLDIRVMNADGSNKIILADTPAQESNPSWSATGKIAYEVSATFGGVTEIWTMNADGTNQARFAAISQPAPLAPAWSPDGTKMAFASGGEIWTINADGTNERRITNNSTVDADPSWSPDGGKIIFGKGGSGIAVVNLDGTNETNLTNGANDGKPSWSSDSTKIAFVRRGSTTDGIYLMNANGAGQSLLIADIPNPRGQQNDNPAWQPVAVPSNTFAIIGRVTRGTTGLNNVTINLTGTTTASATTDAFGNYQFTNLPGGGNYTITPLLAGFTFTPPSRTITNLNAAQTADFTATGTGLCQGGRPCPANGRIVFGRDTTATGPDIYTINPDGSGTVRLTEFTPPELDPSYSPDGTKILFVRNGGIYRMDTDGANVVQLTNSSNDGYPSYSPDGTTIVFARNQRIFKMNADGSNPVQLTNTPANDIQPTFSPDGTKIAFTRGDSSSSAIYTMNANGSNQVRLTNTALPTETSPDYSPDGRNIVFAESPAKISVINTDGTNQTLISSGIFSSDPSYSPDGTKIVFSGKTFITETYKIFMINTDGSGRTQIADNGVFPDWQPIPRARPVLFDFDGDRKSDVSLFRPSNGTWYILPSGAGGFYGFPFGQSGDLIAPADYDGDGKTDVAVFRPVVAGAGDQAYFYILNSSDNSFRAIGFGTNGDVPVSGDWDGDGKGDLAVYRAASAAGGQSNFYYRPSSQPTVNFYTLPLGTAGDKPVPADYDGDGRIDPAVFRPSVIAPNNSATWMILQSSVNQIVTYAFGLPTDIPVPADFNGDGTANIAVFRPSNGTWYTSASPQNNYGAIQFGAAGDLPVPADYDGDGRADTAVFRPATGAWFVNRTTSGLFGVQFGANGDKPTPNAYIR